MKLLKALVLLLLAGLTYPLHSQDLISEEDRVALKAYEDTIALLSFAVINDSLPEHRFGATKKLIPTLVKALKCKNSFHYPFKRVQSISIQYPADSTFRIFTWQLYVDENESRYYGAIQMNSEDLQLFPLYDRSAEVQQPEFEILDNEHWYGALYYNLIPFDSYQGRKYLLFGYDRYSFFQKRKIVDVLSFPNGKPVFGAGVFVESDPEKGQLIRNRLVLEYYAEASIKLNYDQFLNLIVFDHLITIGGVADQGPTKVPDGSYSAYEQREGIWVYVPKVFHEVLDEAPRPEPVLDDKKKIDLFGNQKNN
ncbi:MAG: hypothetical protein KDC44_00675 [Phaeodactylibacter sp.]|nr:hypothetical protein [Phaeodactylibacter sp.]